MLRNILLVISAVLIPFIVIAAERTYKPKDNGRKIAIGLAIGLISVAMLRFFYNASLYEKAYTPAKELTFSYMSLLILFALFAVFNKGKLGEISKKIFVGTALVSVTFPLFANRIFLNPDDTYFVTTALYFVEVGLVTSLATLFVYKEKSMFEPIDLLLPIAALIIYIGIAIGLNYVWKLEIAFDLNFYLGYGLSFVSIFLVFGITKLVEFVAHKNHVRRKGYKEVE